jgi:FtsH-binding integral membrane protein
MSHLTPVFPTSGATAGVRANPYIARTYTVLLNALAAIVVAGVISFQYLPRTTFMPLAVVDMGLWIACGWFGWRRPLTFVMSLFSVVTGALLGQLAHLTPAGVFAQASAYTLVTFAGLSLYVHITKKDFSFLRGILNAAFWIMLVSLAVLISSRSSAQRCRSPPSAHSYSPAGSFTTQVTSFTETSAWKARRLPHSNCS